MNKGGSGIGSASIMLIFSMLCMTIFTLISLSSAVVDEAMANAQERLVRQYYEADARAEQVLAEIIKAYPEIPVIDEYNSDIDIIQDFETGIVSYSVPLKDHAEDEESVKELYVEVFIYDSNEYNVLKWCLQDIHRFDDIRDWEDQFDILQLAPGGFGGLAGE